MLTEIRNRSTGWIAWVIVALITIPFALWGIQSYFEGGNEPPAATVNGEEISVYEYQTALAQQRQQLIQRLGGGFDPALLETLGIKDRVINGLVNEQLFQSYAIDQNFRISDDQLTNMVTSNEAFHEDGRFSQALYLDLLRANNLSPQGFEASQRQQGVLAQLQSGLVDSAFVSESEFNRLLALETQTREVDYIVIPGQQFVNSVEVTDEAIEDEYESNIDRYQTEERMRVKFIELSIDSLSGSIDPSEESVVALYEEIKGRFKKAETRKASHILFAFNQDASDEEKAAIRENAESVLAEANNGGDFAELAKVHSDDPGSGNNGGDLGFIARGQMVKPFEDAVFGMSEGEIRGLVESRFGFHIIKLTALEEGEQQPLEEVRELVESEARKREAENLFAEMGESFQNLVFEDPENLTTAADELDLEIQTSDWFTRDAGQGVASDAQVRRVAFSEDVVNDGLVSQTIEIGFEKLIAVQVHEHEPASAKALSDVRSEIASTLKSIESMAKAQEAGEAYLEQLGNSTATVDWETFAQGAGLEINVLPQSRADIAPDLLALGDAAFSQNAPASGEVNLGGVVLANGDYVVYALKGVTLGEVENANEAEKSRLRNRLIERDGAELYYGFSEFLRNNAEVSINRDLL